MATFSDQVVPSPTALDPFIKVYGNKYRRFHFIALRFQRAIITYQPNTLDTVPIEPPPYSILVLRGGKCPTISTAHSSFLLFTLEAHGRGIRVTHPSTEYLLRALFPPTKILLSFFKSDVLFIIATENPFACIMTKCRKEQAFKSLCRLAEARLQQRALTLTEVSTFRFFKRYQDTLSQFNKWTHFAFYLGYTACLETTLCPPSAYLGREVFLILKRSEHPPGLLPPPEFYQCELLMSETDPVGVAYAVDEHHTVQYVSAMVVSKQKTAFRDAGRMLCNAWLPLYRNRETWNHFGVVEYVHDLHVKKDVLKQILAWVYRQTSTKYQWMYRDLVHVAYILWGDMGAQDTIKEVL